MSGILCKNGPTVVYVFWGQKGASINPIVNSLDVNVVGVEH